MSWGGLLNHQLMPEEGGLGILTPFEHSSSRKKVKITTKQNTLRKRLYEAARSESSELDSLLTMLASLKTRVVEVKKSSCIVFDWRAPTVVKRAAPVCNLPKVEIETEKDPFDNPQSWK